MKKTYLLMLQLLIAAPAFTQQTFRNINFRVQETAGSVTLMWTSLSETNLDRHEVEKSSDGNNFVLAGSVIAQNNKGTVPYSFRDATPAQGINYYRLRSVSQSGAVTYSDAVRIDMGYRKTAINLYPNPVRGGRVQLQMNNIPAGKYAIMVVNSTGQPVYRQSMDLSDGYSTQFINLPSNLGKGLYDVQLTNGESRLNSSLLVN